jgi:hypothetical protein
VAKQLIAGGVGTQGQMQAEADWIGAQYHPDWSFVRGLRQGIGIHHGRIPRSLSQLAVRAFNDGRLRFLVVTSTLIEGVNTTAKNVVIFDNKIATRRYDYFTFNNIKGRSGRMFNHFVGHVYLFHETPEETLRDIDVPILTQPDDAAPSLLIQLDEDELTQRSLETLSDVLSQDDLPVEDLRQGGGVDPHDMIEVARRLRQSSALRRQLSWRGLPNWDQLQKTCEVIWDDLGGDSFRGSYVRTHGQLAFRISRLRIDGIRGLIDAALEEEDSPDQAVEDVLDFVRQWAGFHFPRLLMVLERIFNRVASSLGAQHVSYAYFATQVESLFRPKSLVALEEYGLPIQIGDRIHEAINLDVPLDDALSKLKQVNPESMKLQSFERETLRDVQRHI